MEWPQRPLRDKFAGLALRNTLGDVLAGLAINVERPFASGDWISVGEQSLGQVIEVNWRATCLKTWSNDMPVIPNSTVTKAVVTNHSRPAARTTAPFA